MENQHDILKTVIDGLVYIPTKDMIVKPLEDEYVEKEIIKPVETGKKDENGYDINPGQKLLGIWMKVHS